MRPKQLEKFERFLERHGEMQPESLARVNPSRIFISCSAIFVQDTIYDDSNALTHRYLVVHDMMSEAQANSDISRINYDDFLSQTILAFQIARAAIVYLIQFVEHMEEVEVADQSHSYRTVYAAPIRYELRHRPGC